jgi:hypothetical protein
MGENYVLIAMMIVMMINQNNFVNSYQKIYKIGYKTLITGHIYYEFCYFLAKLILELPESPNFKFKIRRFW